MLSKEAVNWSKGQMFGGATGLVLRRVLTQECTCKK